MTTDYEPLSDPNYVPLRSVVAETLVAVSPGQFPGIGSALRVAALVTQAVLRAQNDGSEGQS